MAEQAYLLFSQLLLAGLQLCFVQLLNRVLQEFLPQGILGAFLLEIRMLLFQLSELG